MNRKRNIEKRPNFIKVLLTRFIFCVIGVVLIFCGIIMYLSDEYTRYVDAVKNAPEQNLEKSIEKKNLGNFVLSEEERMEIVSSIISEIIDKSCDDNLEMLPVLKAFMKVNLTGNMKKVPPVEIEIYDYNEKYLFSNMEREYEYFKRKKDCTKIECSEMENMPSEKLADLRYRVIAYYSFMYDCKDGVMLLAFALMLSAIAFGTIFSIVSYYKKKARYEIYEYRRNITNSMAHDLKSPLMIISGYTQNLMENEHDEMEQHFLESMLDTVEYMDKIIVKSLELYRLEERDKKSLRKEEIHVEEIISDVLVKYAEVLKERGLKAKMQAEHSLIADYTVFENIITNIISNISKYAKENSEFLITIESKRITFSNVIEEEITVSENELFTPFVKGNKSRTGQNGTGLGLSIVKALCELQGYRVSITVIDGNFVLIIS